MTGPSSMPARQTSGHIDSVLFRDMYSTEEMRAVFSDVRLVGAWLRVEVALANAQAAHHVIPLEAAKEIEAKAVVDDVDLEAIARETKKTGHVIVAFLRVFESLLSEAAAQYLHYGSTTQDIQDTAYVLMVGEASTILVRDALALESDLLDLAEAHASTVMAGRTHGQHALPTTFGLKVASWARELRRAIRRLERAACELEIGQFGGAVGTMAGYGEQAQTLQAAMMSSLGLQEADLPWHTARDRLCDFLYALAMLGNAVARAANQVVVLQRTEIAELQEPWSSTQVGSSTMPHKQNPQRAELIVALARLLNADAVRLLSSLTHEDERDPRNWKAEWLPLTESCLLSSGILEKAKLVFSGLRVDADRMAANLRITGDAVFSESIMMFLAPSIGRMNAHRMLLEVAAEASRSGGSLRDALLARGFDVPAEVLDPRVHVDHARDLTIAATTLSRQQRAQGDRDSGRE